MFNQHLHRLCSQCGINPVHSKYPRATVCERCAIDNLLSVLKEPNLCPRCKFEMPLPKKERGVCPNCGYVEETED